MKPHGNVLNPHLTLGISTDASTDEVRRAYRSLALKNHPDANPEDPLAEERFKEIQHAYELLSSSTRRASMERDVYLILKRLKTSLALSYGLRGGMFMVEVSLGKSCSRELRERIEHRKRKLFPASGFVKPRPPQPPEVPRKCR